ncbi:MAG: trypsin-like serine protease [Phycisphaerae bacterium]|jgi:serine protease Do|nr:trypsin-like serine protease [Phycisphaerae bacterium]MBT6269207.1 trypsin-like serine protease [Phycisphaerae bacterium]MBT6283377.1 trypsin-like serine protease [Phycisphaerae bacterium]
MIKQQKCVLTFLLALLMIAISSAYADVVYLHGGSEVHGNVIKRTDNTLWIDIGPKVIQINMTEIEDVLIDAEDIQSKKMNISSLFRTAEGLPELSPNVQAKRVGSSVIKVSTPGGLGSGVLLNGEGFAITNAHVIQSETDLRATVWIPQADGSLMRTTIEDVEIIAVNNHLDLALLLLKHPDDKPFEFSVLENAENIEVGEIVFAIGNPLGLERSMSQGVISTKHRSFDGLTYIQTDAAINPGNSGGPLFNSRGEVVGITNMGIASAESLNFAIPTRYVKDFIRNREAFAYDEKNPNSGHLYHVPPRPSKDGIPPQLLDDAGKS